MRQIERTTVFRRDYKKVIANSKHKDMENVLPAILALLAHDKPLPEKYRDHALRGDWKDHRDCHIKPDLVMIYRRSTAGVLQLVRLGSHSELGL